MTVMQLEGESAQLRQVARLHANGDITLDDYRNIRTVMIDAFLADLGDSPVVSAPTDSSATLIGVEMQVPERQYAAANADGAAGLRSGNAATESTMALLAILGAGAMLLIVAMLAIGLGT